MDIRIHANFPQGGASSTLRRYIMAMALLFTLSEELLVAVLSQLEARDLRHVAVAHPKFGLLQCCAVAMPAPRVTRVSVVECELDMPPPPCGCGCMRPTSTHVRWTLVQAAAWLQIQAYSTVEQAWLPRMPLPSQRFDLSSRIQSGHPRCWLWALAELEALKRPFRFSQVHEQARVATSPANPAVHVVDKVEPPSGAGHYNDSEWASAIGSTVMRAGQHYCEFTWVRGDGVMLGIVTDSRAAKQRIDAAMKASGELWLTPCSYFFSGAEGERVHWGDDFSWAGRRGAQIGDRIGLLLDCDRMTLAVYINDTRLGVMLPWHLQAGPMEPAWRLRAQRTTRAGMDGPW